MNQQQIYFDSVRFWGRMGVKKTENRIALAMCDVLNAFKERTCKSFQEPHYIEIGKELIKELQSKKYDNNRGKVGWLEEFDF